MATLNQQVQSFVRNQKNAGAKGLEILSLCIEHMYGESNDWTPLAWLIAKTEANDARVLRAILGRVTSGLTVKKDKDQPSGLRIVRAGNSSTTELYGTMKKLIDEKQSFRSKTVREQLLPPKDSADFDIKKYVKRVMSKIENEGVTLADFLAAIEAEEVQPAK